MLTQILSSAVSKTVESFELGSVKWRRRMAGKEVFRISIASSLSPPLPSSRGFTPALIPSRSLDATTRQPVAFITRLSNAPTAKRENNAKALHRDYLLKSITRCKEGERETLRLRLSITLLRTILPLQCYSNYKRHRIFHFSHAEYQARDR